MDLDEWELSDVAFFLVIWLGGTACAVALVAAYYWFFYGD